MKLVGLACAVAIVACKAPVRAVAFEERKLQGNASVDDGRYEPELVGKLDELSSKRDGDVAHWQVRVTANGESHEYRIALPATLDFPVAQGADVTIETSTIGGGPNARVQLALTDERGLALAIGRLPAGWHAEPGEQVDVHRGSTSDSRSFAVLVHSANERAPAELVAGWRQFTLAGQRYVGNGEAVTNDLHGQEPPPDYVHSWTDYTLVRVHSGSDEHATK